MADTSDTFRWVARTDSEQRPRELWTSSGVAGSVIQEEGRPKTAIISDTTAAIRR